MVSSVEIADAVFFCFNTTAVTPPVGEDIRAAEVGDANFTQAEGSGSPLLLADQLTPATNHDYYITISSSPTSVGLKSNTMRWEGVIQ